MRFGKDMISRLNFEERLFAGAGSGLLLGLGGYLLSRHGIKPDIHGMSPETLHFEVKSFPREATKHGLWATGYVGSCIGMFVLGPAVEYAGSVRDKAAGFLPKKRTSKEIRELNNTFYTSDNSTEEA